jgi:hypothetical protein
MPLASDAANSQTNQGEIRVLVPVVRKGWDFEFLICRPFAPCLGGSVASPLIYLLSIGPEMCPLHSRCR